MSATKQDPSLFKIVVAHYTVSAFCFLALAVMLSFSFDALSGHYFHPKLLALTHLAALGWGTLIIFGAAYQLLPVVLETDLFSKKLAWISFALFVPGLAALVYSFWVFNPGIHMQCGSLLLLGSILMFAINVFFTARGKIQESVQQELIVTSSVWLVATALLGTLMVFNFRFAFLPKDHLEFLKLHAHMGIGGWFLLLIIGVSSKLIPMFLVSAYKETRLLSLSYYLINGALVLFLIDTYLSGLNIRSMIFGFMAGAGIISYMVYVQKCYASRIKKKTDLPMLNSFLSLLMLAVAIVLLPFIVYYHVKSDPAAVRFSVLYGSLLFMGWISALILGQTFKTLPFIVWSSRYEHLTGRVKTPMPADLYKSNLLKWQSVGFIVFCLSFYIGLLLAYEPLIMAGTFSLLLTAICYVSNVLTVLLHKTKTAEYDKI